MSKKPALGQHFLKDAHYLNDIIEAAKLVDTDTVLEIGPGEGDLTRLLAARSENVKAVELDILLAKKLVGQMPSNVEVVQSDIRDFDLSTMGEGYKVVANIPYYISGEVIRLLLGASNKPDQIVLLVQKEVAQRAAAQPGKQSVLGISAQLLADVELGSVVPADAFTPPPQVESQVLILSPLPKPRIKVDVDSFMKLVKAAFSQKRKKLSNSLASFNGAPEALDKLGIAGKRAQELDFVQWEKLYRQIVDG